MEQSEQPPVLTLQEVDRLLHEFHYANTTNERKREIETQLVHFQNHPRSWSYCVNCLTEHSNEYVWFFKVSTIELAISRRWNTLRPPERNQIRDPIWSVYVDASANAIRMKRDKCAQLLAMIGKREFPNENPAYMSHVTQLITTNFTLGIALLKATSDELVSTKEDVSFDTKKKFHSALSTCMPEMFELINKFLMISCYRMNSNAILDSDPTLFRNLAAVMPNDDNLFCTSVIDLLTCIQHLFTWVPLDDIVSEQLIFSLFDLANWRECASEVSVGGLATLSELFYRQMALPHVKSIANGIKTILEQQNLKKSNELYQDRLTELLKLFTTQHWTQWVNNEDLYDVVTSLYHFTFSGYGALAFTERLSIWCPMIQGLSSTGFGGYGRYVEIVHLLITGILRKMQFRFDQDAELDVLDNECLDDNMETEWQHYLSQCIETIVLIAEGRPIQVFEQVYNEWQRPFEMFMSLEKSHDGTSLTITDYHKCHLIHCVTRDLSSLCQTLASLIPFLQTYPDELPANLHQLAFNLTYAIDFLSRNKLHSLLVPLTQLSSSFIEIHAQLLSAMRCFLGWSSALKTDAELKRLIENVAYTLRPTSNLTQEPKLITLAAAQLLLSITSMLRSKHILESQSFAQLIQAGNNLTHLDKYAATCIQQSIVNCFVLPWIGVMNAEQDFERRGLLLKEYIECLGQDLLRLDHTVENGQDNKIAKITITVLPPLKDILDFFKDQTSPVKQMLMAAYKQIIAKASSLLNNIDMSNGDIVTCVLNFFLSVIRTLQLQLGTSHVHNMLEWFLGFVTRDQLTASSLKAIDKLLQMLLFVVEQPGNATMSLLPNILGFVLDHVMPLLMEEKQSLDFGDVATSVFNLLHGVLQYRWQYFYRSTILHDTDTTGPLANAPAHFEHFAAIFTAYGRVLVGGNDPHVAKLILASLDSLNDRYKLFTRTFFVNNFISSFQCAVISALMAPGGGVLHTEMDSLLSILYAMSNDDNRWKLAQSFESLGFQKELCQDVIGAQDMPTFVQVMGRLIMDTRCKQLEQ